MEPLLSLISFPNRYKSCPLAAQNKYDDVQPVAEVASRNHAVFPVVFPLVREDARGGPVEATDLIECNPVLPQIDRVLRLIPIKVHGFPVHPSDAMSANARTFCEENQ
jgi:hypothetical protein